MQKILTKNKTVQKFISSLIILTILTPALLVSFTPKKAEAQWVVSDPAHTAITLKIVIQEIWKQAMMAIARKLLNKITQSTVNWINSGFHGNPLYVENSGSFFKDIAKYEVRNLVDSVGYNSLQFPFGKSFALNTIDAYKRQFEDNASYSLSKAIDDPVFLNNFRNDFNVGGWNGFLINTQYPQNNYIGFQILATEQLALRLDGTSQNAAQKVNTTLQQGLGFLSPQTCPSNPAYNNLKNQFQQPTFKTTLQYEPPRPGDFPTAEAFNDAWLIYDRDYEGRLAAERDTFTLTSTCPGGLVSTTPGSVVGDQVKVALASKIKQGELAAALGNSLAAIFDALINKFMSVGLNALSDKLNPPEPPPTETDVSGFTYMGSSISDLSSTYGADATPPSSFWSPSDFDFGGGDGGEDGGGGGGGGSGESHAECSGGACIGVDGPGANECSNDADC